MAVKYNVYFSTTAIGPWTLANAIPIDHIDSGNQYTITGLKSGTTYYVKIIGGTVSGTTFQPLINQPIGPASVQAASVDIPTITPLAIRTYEARVIANAGVGHEITVTV